MENLFYTAQELATMFGISSTKAYQLIQEWNKELSAKKFITVPGKIYRAYVNERIYGYNGREEAM